MFFRITYFVGSRIGHGNAVGLLSPPSDGHPRQDFPAIQPHRHGTGPVSWLVVKAWPP